MKTNDHKWPFPPEPTTALFTFTFPLDSLDELEDKILERVGYKLGPSDIDTLLIQGELSTYKVILTVWYWNQEKVNKYQEDLIIQQGEDIIDEDW